MAAGKRLGFWVTGWLVVLLALLLSLRYVVPLLVNLDFLKGKILAELSQRVGGEIQASRIDLSFYPRPSVVVDRGSVVVPGKLRATVHSLTAYPEILPLLKGEVRVSMLLLKGPSVRVELPQKPKSRGKPTSQKDVEEAVASALAVAAERAPGLTLEIGKGELELVEEGQSRLKLHDLGGEVRFPPGAFKVDLTCRSDLWQGLTLQASFDPRDHRGKGRVLLKQLRLHSLLDLLSLRLTPHLADSEVDLEVHVGFDGQGTLQATCQGVIPRLAFQGPRDTMVIRGKDLKAAFRTDAKKMTLVLEALQLEYPGVRLSGKFETDRKTSSAAVEVVAEEVEVESTRAATLFLAGHVPAVQILFDFLREGKVPRVTLASQGRSPEDLLRTRNITVEGKLLDGSVVIPQTIARFLSEDISLTGVQGDVVMAKGILHGRHIEATWENEHLQEVTLGIGLEGEDALFHAEGSLEVDLSQLPPHLKRLLKDEALSSEISRFEGVKGRLQGRFALGERMKSLKAKIDTQDLRLSFHYGPVPYRLAIRGGSVSYDGEKLSVEGLVGSFGKSTFSDFTGQVSLEKTVSLSLEKGKLTACLEEFYAWLASGPSMTGERRGLESLAGTLTLSIAHLKGPVLHPEQWDFRAAGNVAGLVAEVSQVDGPVEVTEGKVDVEPDRVSFRDVQATFLGTPLDLSGRVEGFLKKPLRVDLSTRVDLSELPRVVRRLSKGRALEKELSLLSDLKGSTTARLILEGQAEQSRVRVEASGLVASARYRRIPYPVEIRAGQVAYERGKVTLKDFNGNVGRSSFSDLSSEIDLGGEPQLRIHSGKASVLLDEVYPWLNSYEALHEGLKEIKSLEGTVVLSRVNLHGPVSKPERWQVEAQGEVSAFRTTASVLPEPLVIEGGRFLVEGGRLRLADLRVRILDSPLTISGTVEDYLKGLKKAEIDLDGEISTRGSRWLIDRLQTKHRAYIKAPVRVSGGRLSWQKGDQTGFRGNLAVEKGPQISLDLLQRAGELALNHLVVSDEGARAQVSLLHRGRSLNGAFAGTLSERTLSKIFTDYPPPDGRIRGSLEASVDLDRPMRSNAKGKLEIDSFSFPSYFEKPLELLKVSLAAEGNRVKIVEGDFRWGEKQVALSGTGTVSGDHVLVDVDMTTSGLSLEEIQDAFPKKGKDTGSTKSTTPLPVRGTVRLRSDSLRVKNFTWSPFSAETSLVSGGVRVEVKEADLCGISTPGALEILGPDLSLRFQPVSKGQDLHQSLTCLFEKKADMTGKFDLNGTLRGQGAPKELFPSLAGDVTLTARQGRIYRAEALSRVFAFLNVTEVFVGKFPDFRQEGLPFDSVEIEGTLDKSKLKLKKTALKGPSVQIAGRGEVDLIEEKMDVTFLVAPLRFVDRLVNLIPLVRTILGGTLVSVPVRVVGPLDDPRVILLSPTAVGQEVLEMFKRTMTLPVKMIDPFLREKDKK